MDLSRIARGGTPIQLDRPRLLFYDAAATWLIYQKYKQRYIQELYSVVTPPADWGKKGVVVEFQLNSMEALGFYLWAGLQADCKLRGEELTLEQVTDLIDPSTFPRIFNAVITAIGRNMSSPQRPGDAGKANAAAAGPDAVADPRPVSKTTRSTSTKKSGSHSARSAGRQKSSGPVR